MTLLSIRSSAGMASRATTNVLYAGDRPIVRIRIRSLSLI